MNLHDIPYVRMIFDKQNFSHLILRLAVFELVIKSLVSYRFNLSKTLQDSSIN